MIFSIWIAGFAFTTQAAEATLDLAPKLDLTQLRAWINGQKNIHTLSAEFTQTRSLRMLRSPLVIKGRFHFQAPSSFRWELGDPPKTIVAGTPTGLIILEPAKKKVIKKSPFSSGGLISSEEMGIPLPGKMSFEMFQEQMQVLNFKTSGPFCHLEMLPRDARATQALACIKLDFNSSTGHLLRLEIVTKDGSTLVNEFSNVQINLKLEKGCFDVDFTGLEVIDEKN